MRRRRWIAMVLSAMACAAAFAAPVSAQGWRDYTNDRYGTHSEVPPGFVMQPPPGNDDGRTFRAPDGAVLRVFANANVLDDTPDAYATRQIGYGGFGVVSFRRATKTWAVVSGTRGATIAYEKFVFGRDGIIHQMLIEYPAARKDDYASIVSRLAASLRGP